MSADKCQCVSVEGTQKTFCSRTFVQCASPSEIKVRLRESLTRCVGGQQENTPDSLVQSVEAKVSDSVCYYKTQCGAKVYNTKVESESRQ